MLDWLHNQEQIGFPIKISHSAASGRLMATAPVSVRLERDGKGQA
jgi:hypothetical protein